LPREFASFVSFLLPAERCGSIPPDQRRAQTITKRWLARYDCELMNRLRRWLVITCLVLPLWAADLSGKWRLPFTDAEGKEQESVFTFTVAGDKVTGTLVQKGKTRSIEEGRFSGDVVTFAVHTSKGVSRYEGHLKEDRIEFDVWREGEEQRYHPVAYRIQN
jgi:hypothetical protein